MNISITTTAETLIQQLLELGHETPEAIVEQALQCFYSQQSIDTAIGFPNLTEAEILRENDDRWQAFQQNPQGISQSAVEAHFADRLK